MLLKVALNTITLTPNLYIIYLRGHFVIEMTMIVYGSWILSSNTNQYLSQLKLLVMHGVLDTILYDKVCQCVFLWIH